MEWTAFLLMYMIYRVQVIKWIGSLNTYDFLSEFYCFVIWSGLLLQETQAGEPLEVTMKLAGLLPGHLSHLYCLSQCPRCPHLGTSDGWLWLPSWYNLESLGKRVSMKNCLHWVDLSVGIVFNKLTGVGRPSPLWVATLPRQGFPKCIRMEKWSWPQANKTACTCSFFLCSQLWVWAAVSSLWLPSNNGL